MVRIVTIRRIRVVGTERFVCLAFGFKYKVSLRSAKAEYNILTYVKELFHFYNFFDPDRLNNKLSVMVLKVW